MSGILRPGETKLCAERIQAGLERRLHSIRVHLHIRLGFGGAGADRGVDAALHRLVHRVVDRAGDEVAQLLLLTIMPIRRLLRHRVVDRPPFNG